MRFAAASDNLLLTAPDLSIFCPPVSPYCAAVQVRGSVAYAAQDPWIRNASLRDNILMGLPFRQQRYRDCLEACALLPDLDLLPARDATEIGGCRVRRPSPPLGPSMQTTAF